MSTKLNADGLAKKYAVEQGAEGSAMWHDGCAFAIAEVAQPLVYELALVKAERDEMREALEYMVSIGEDQGWTDDFLEIPRTILAKYPKP